MNKKLLPVAPALILAAVFMTTVMTSVVTAHATIIKPTDAKITRAVERELLLSRRVPSHWIDVNTDNGIVTLTGSVNNLLARDRASELARSIKGVRAVVNRMTVQTPLRPDLEIRNNVIAAVVSDPVTDAYEVIVKAQDGVVTLKGNVESWVEKELAEKVVKGIKGVREVKNEITFEYETSRRDPEIAADVRSRLKWNPRIDDGLIAVEVEQGQVRLNGAVGSAAEKNIAYADAWVAGVKTVDTSALKVEWWARDKMRRGQACAERSDEDLILAIKGAFMNDPRVSFFKPEVEVENYVVTLTGIVDNLKAKRAAEMDAKNTACILRVKNHLKVRPFKVLPDNTIAHEVRAAFERDPHISGADIGVSVSNSKVFLYGEVDSIYDLMQAEDLASRINGVVEVQNNLRVHDILNAKTDREIKEEIQEQLWWSPFVDSDSIAVSVTDGVATLTGIANSRLEVEAAAANAKQGGAKNVVNQLKIIGYPNVGL